MTASGPWISGSAERLTSHLIIEEFMLSANEAASKVLARKQCTDALTRIHEDIAPDKLYALKGFLWRRSASPCATWKTPASRSRRWSTGSQAGIPAGGKFRDPEVVHAGVLR
jgi:hypothetical protein